MQENTWKGIQKDTNGEGTKEEMIKWMKIKETKTQKHNGVKGRERRRCKTGR